MSRAIQIIVKRLYIYDEMPHVNKVKTDPLLFLTYADQVTENERDVVVSWVQDQAGSSLYERLVADFQRQQCTEQLALVMAALVSYRKINPDLNDDKAGPPYLADLRDFLHGEPLTNSGRIIEEMASALVTRLECDALANHNLIPLLTSSLSPDRSPSHPANSLSVEYMGLRTGAWSSEELSHLAAIGVIATRMPNLRLPGTTLNDITLWNSQPLNSSAYVHARKVHAAC